MGHEFCCEVVELGPGCENLAEGDVVVSMPAAFDAAGVHAIGFSNHYPGGYAERIVLNDLLAPEGPERPGAPAGGADRAVRRRRARGGQERHPQRRRGDRPRLRSDRAGRDRRPEAAGRRPGRGRRPLAGAAGAGRAAGRRRGGRSHASSRPSRRGGGSTAPGRSSSSRPSACPACSTPACGWRPKGTRITVVGACMRGRHRAADDRHRQGAVAPVRAGLRAPRVRRRPHGASPRARSTWSR